MFKVLTAQLQFIRDVCIWCDSFLTAEEHVEEGVPLFILTQESYGLVVLQNACQAGNGGTGSDRLRDCKGSMSSSSWSERVSGAGGAGPTHSTYAFTTNKHVCAHFGTGATSN